MYNIYEGLNKITEYIENHLLEKITNKEEIENIADEVITIKRWKS